MLDRLRVLFLMLREAWTALVTSYIGARSMGPEKCLLQLRQSICAHIGTSKRRGKEDGWQDYRVKDDDSMLHTSCNFSGIEKPPVNIDNTKSPIRIEKFFSSYSELR